MSREGRRQFLHGNLHLVLELPAPAVVVHVLSDLPRGAAEVRIRPVADIDEPDLVRLAVAASEQRLVAVLEPVAADDARIAESALHEAGERPRALLLAPHGTQPRLEHSAVEAAEVELSDEERFFGGRLLVDVVGYVVYRVGVRVDCNDVAVFGGNGPQFLGLPEPDEAAAEVELVRSELVQYFAACPEVRLQELRIAGELELVVDEEPDAHGVGRGLCKRGILRKALSYSALHLLWECWIGGVVEAHSVAGNHFHALRVLKHAYDVRLASEHHEVACTPVSYRVDSPRIEPLQHQVVVFRREVLFAELLLERLASEHHARRRRVVRFVPAGMLAAVGYVGLNARDVDAEGEEETSLGGDEEPPAADARGPEVPGGLEMRTVLPAAEPVPRLGRGLESLQLQFEVLRKGLVVLHLVWPVDVLELSVLVDERTVLLGVDLARDVGLAFQP